VQVLDRVYDSRIWRRVQDRWRAADYEARQARFSFAVALIEVERASLAQRQGGLKWPEYVAEGKPGYDEFVAARAPLEAESQRINARLEELTRRLAYYWERDGV
jgi:hypothetical protein